MVLCSWCRAVPGEDPVLTSRYATAYVRGLQEGDDPRYIKVIATCKHFFAYDVDCELTHCLMHCGVLMLKT